MSFRIRKRWDSKHIFRSKGLTVEAIERIRQERSSSEFMSSSVLYLLGGIGLAMAAAGVYIYYRIRLRG